MMSEKQALFRREYRSRIDGWYNGYVHIAVIYGIGIPAMYVYIQNITAVLWWEWLTIPADHHQRAASDLHPTHLKSSPVLLRQ